MKVYVVTAGEYSDYHIECVTLSYETAEEYIKRRSGDFYGDSFEIEKYDTDDLDGYLADKRSCWIVWKIKGRISSQQLTDVGLPDCGYRWGCVQRMLYNGRIFVNVKAETQKKAEKIAEDLFTKYEAEKAGIT